MSDQPESVGREVLYEVTDYVAVVTLNRPEKRNAVDAAVTQALDWIVRETERDSAAYSRWRAGSTACRAPFPATSRSN